MFDKIKTNVSGKTGEAAAGGVDYPVSPHPASEAYPAGESMPGGEGNRRQIRWYSVAWIIRSSRIMTVFIYVLKVPRSSRIMTGTEQDGRIITEKECRL